MTDDMRMWARVSWREGNFIRHKTLPLDVAEEKKAKLEAEGVKHIRLSWPVDAPKRRERGKR